MCLLVAPVILLLASLTYITNNLKLNECVCPWCKINKEIIGALLKKKVLKIIHGEDWIK